MMHMGLQLLTVALESGHLANYQSLLVLVKDELCRHLLQVLEDAEENIVLYCDKKKKKFSCISLLYLLSVTLTQFQFNVQFTFSLATSANGKMSSSNYHHIMKTRIK